MLPVLLLLVGFLVVIYELRDIKSMWRMFITEEIGNKSIRRTAMVTLFIIFMLSTLEYGVIILGLLLVASGFVGLFLF